MLSVVILHVFVILLYANIRILSTDSQKFRKAKKLTKQHTLPDEVRLNRYIIIQTSILMSLH